MGAETQCKARSNGRESTGKAYLETSELLFRGDFRVAFKFAELNSVEAVDGVLALRSASRALDLELGPLAEKWRDKIRNPKSLIDKLGVKFGRRIAVIGVDDVDFLAQLAAVQPDFSTELDGVFDMIFYAVESPADLARLQRMVQCLAPKGSIWTISRKGKAATLKDVDIIAAGRSAGLVDVKVAAFSSTHTAQKFVLPVN